jgi:hypothetical protein
LVQRATWSNWSQAINRQHGNAWHATHHELKSSLVQRDHVLRPVETLPGPHTPALAENTVLLAVFRASIELEVGWRGPILGLWFSFEEVLGDRHTGWTNAVKDWQSELRGRHVPILNIAC